MAKGSVLAWTAMSGTGLITGEDGGRYPFAAADWRSDRLPRQGDKVDFDPQHGRAADIYLIKASGIDMSGAADTAKNAAGAASSWVSARLQPKPDGEPAPVVLAARRLVSRPVAFYAALFLVIGVLFNYLVISLFGRDSGISLVRSPTLAFDDGLQAAVQRLSRVNRGRGQELEIAINLQMLNIIVFALPVMLLFADLRRGARKVTTVALAGITLVLLLVIPNIFVLASNDLLARGRTGLLEFSLGIGWWLLLAVCIVMLLAPFRFIPAPLGRDVGRS